MVTHSWRFTIVVASLMDQKSFQRKMMCRKSCFAFLQEIAKLCQYNNRWRRQNKHFLEVCKKNYSENNQTLLAFVAVTVYEFDSKTLAALNLWYIQGVLS